MSKENKEKSPPSAVKIRGWFQGIMKSMRTVRPSTRNETSRNSIKKWKTKLAGEERQLKKDSDSVVETTQSPKSNSATECVDTGLIALIHNGKLL